MFKRFVIGFAIGMIATQWYINNSTEVRAQVNAWFGRSSSKYRGDHTHEAARNILDSSRP